MIRTEQGQTLHLNFSRGAGQCFHALVLTLWI